MARSHVTGRDVTFPEDCTQCGACCFGREPGYLRVFEVDRARMADVDPWLVEEQDDGKAHMRMVQGRCAALRLDPATSRLVCAIYPVRPDVCRWLARGSGDCHAHRVAKCELADAFREQLRLTGVGP
jgi:Fe-S-cluster containining protein